MEKICTNYGDYMIIAFTGHRPSNPYFGGYNLFSSRNIEISNKVKSVIKTFMQQYGNKESYHFIVGGALGFDQLAASVVLDLREQYKNFNIILEYAIPFKYQYIKWNKNDIKRYCRQILLANIITVVDMLPEYNLDRKTKTGYYSAYKMFLRDQYMVDQLVGKNSFLIALYDNKSVNSGTHKTIMYAKNCDIRIIYI